MDIIIAGGGVSAFEAAAAARKNCADCNIVIHSAENIPPYRRPALPGLIAAGEEEFAKIFIRKEDFYQQNNITLVLNSRLTGMDPDKKEVTFNGTQTCHYDKLILATGGKAFLPPLPGVEQENVLTLRNYADLTALRQKIAAGARKITVIGGGILGLEIVDSLLKCQVSVTLLERSERLLKRDVSPEDSQMMMESLADLENFRLICSANTAKIIPQRLSRRVSSSTPAKSSKVTSSSFPPAAVRSCPASPPESPSIAVSSSILTCKAVSPTFSPAEITPSSTEMSAVFTPPHAPWQPSQEAAPQAF